MNTQELSPVMHQYLSIKKEHKDVLLFYRMGDFYELFYDDAEIAAKELNIVLTKKQIKNQNIPMCGVPYHSYESYLNRLIKAGFKVAICEQLEQPSEAKKRGYKSVIKRGVQRIITPGTLTEDSLLPNDTFNYLMGINIIQSNASISWVDISTGDFYFETCNIKELRNIIYRVLPKEIIISERHLKYIKDEFNGSITELSNERFNYLNNMKLLQQNFHKNNFPELSEQEVIICGVVLDYINLTQKLSMPRLSEPKVWQESNSMRMDFFTRQSLELFSKMNGEKSASLKSVINQTLTSSGSRLLQEWLNSPLVDIQKINDRLEVVEYFYNNPDILKIIRDLIKNSSDLIRVLGRLSIKRGNPRDLLLVKHGLNTIMLFRNHLINLDVPVLLKKLLLKPKDFSVLFDTLNRAIIDSSDLPSNIKEGGFIRSGYKPELDIIRANKQKNNQSIMDLQDNYVGNTNINNLKIQYNNIIGYFIEVPSKSASKLLENSKFIHKQTLSNIARFTTKELMDVEANIIRTRNKELTIEQEAFFQLVDMSLSYSDTILDAGKAISVIDILSSFATLSIEYDLVKPMLNNSKKLNIIAGRHLVVEAGLKKQLNSKFISNNCNMNEEKNVFIITGPNMAGKSTFLRQNAIIIILAQIGCFVPANYAEIGIVDAIFSRVGSGDNLYKGQSTFMVEMMETSIILNNATDRSFVILDEIGRGTSTYDGLSIAFAVVEYLHNYNKSRVLFATHYHEIIELKDKLNKLELYYMAVESDKDDLIFMHKVSKGSAEKSYGIYAAKLAGMPQSIINKAKIILNALENKETKKHRLPLFELCDNKENEEISNNDLSFNVLNKIKQLDVDSLTPKEALNWIYDIKKEIKESL